MEWKCDSDCKACGTLLDNVPVNKVSICPGCGKYVLPCYCCDFVTDGNECDYSENNGCTPFPKPYNKNMIFDNVTDFSIAKKKLKI